MRRWKTPLWGTTLASASILSGGLVVYLGQLEPLGAMYNSFALLMLLILILGILPFCAESMNGSFDLFNAKNVFVLYMLLQFVVWPTWVLVAGYQSFAGGSLRITFFADRYEDAVLGLAYALVALCSFYFGYYIVGRGHRKLKEATRYPSIRLNRASMNAITALLLLVGFLSFAVFLRKQTSVFDYLRHIDEFRSFGLLGFSYLFYGMYLILVAFQLVYMVHALQGGYKGTAALLFVASLAVSLLAAYRHMAIETIASWVVVRHYAKKRFRLTLGLAAGVVLFLFLNVLYVSFRGRLGNPFDILYSSGAVGAALFEGLFGRFHGAESVARIVDITGQTGFTGGKYVLQDLIFSWVPRAIWPGKPSSAGNMVNVLFFGDGYYGYETGAAVPTLVGGLYWIAGLPGVLLGMLLIGKVLRLAYDYWLRPRQLLGLGVYVQIFLFAMFVNEDLSLHLGRLLYRLVIWLVVIGWCAGFKVRPQRLRAEA